MRFLRLYAIQRSLAGAIELAAYARTPGGKKNSHQRRLPRTASEKADHTLKQNEAQLARCRTFAEPRARHHVTRRMLGVTGLVVEEVAAVLRPPTGGCSDSR